MADYTLQPHPIIHLIAWLPNIFFSPQHKFNIPNMSRTFMFLFLIAEFCISTSLFVSYLNCGLSHTSLPLVTAKEIYRYITHRSRFIILLVAETTAICFSHELRFGQGCMEMA